jgi:hypothetical protein
MGVNMRCIACDSGLTDYETSRKSIITGDYINMCSSCFRDIKNDCLAVGNPSLLDDSEDDTIEDGSDLIDNDLFDDTDYWSER